MTETNCPFYGRSLYQPMTVARKGLPFVLLATSGNQCALVQEVHAPCYMQANRLEVDWRHCPVSQDVRIGGER